MFWDDQEHSSTRLSNLSQLNKCHLGFLNAPEADTFEAALLQAPEKHWFLKRSLALNKSRRFESFESTDMNLIG